MKKRFGGRAVAALILLLGAAFSVYTACFWRPPPRPLVILSERVIYESKDGTLDTEWKHWAPAFLSPDGRYLILICDSPDNGYFNGAQYVLDTRTGKLIKLPFPPGCWRDNSRPNPFTSDGNYIHVVEPKEYGQAPDRPWVFLFDVAARSLRTIKVGSALSVVSDERAESLLVSTWNQDSNIANVSISIGNGAVAKLPFEGEIYAAFGKDRAIVRSNRTLDFALVDMVSGRAIKKFPKQMNQGNSPLFRTADGRFLCYTEVYEVVDFRERVRNLVGAILPSVRDSQSMLSFVAERGCFWEIAENRSARLWDDAIARAPGPSPSSVWSMWRAVDSGWQHCRLLDLVSRAEYKPGKYGEERIDCTFGNRLVYQVRDMDGGVKIMMIEVAVPEPERRGIAWPIW